MSEESKSENKTFEFPMMPIFGVDLGRELGAIGVRLNQLESDNREIKREIKALDAKIDAKINVLDAKIDAIDAKIDAKIDVLDAKIDAIDAKFEAKTDKMAYALNRLDERTKTDHTLLIGLWVTVIAGIILQIFLK